MKIVGIIPARYASGRMPGKPIEDICERPMIWWVYQEACKCSWVSEWLIATDDERIASKCEEFGLKYLMTSREHKTPTSRLYEVSTKVDADMYLLIMGDEPLISSDAFSLVVPKKIPHKMYVGALSNVIDNPADVVDFSNQKVVTDSNRRALFISRSPIPYPKGTLDIVYEKITGIQIFSKDALDFYNETEPSRLEIAEENDLMRFVEHGVNVYVTESPYKTISVDTPKDLELVRKIMEERLSD